MGDAETLVVRKAGVATSTPRIKRRWNSFTTMKAFSKAFTNL
jgi:hypothetical protein